MARDSWVIEL